jgi:putative ABC transport system ATP-binding protein
LADVCLKDKKLEESPDLFSGGEKQRLGLARILLLKPEVILLDEPSAALDAQIEETIMSLLAAYKKQHQMTYILVTHAENIAQGYSDVIVYMDEGKVIKVEERA